MRITDFSVDRPVTISMIVMIIVVIGVISLSRLGMDLMPDFDYPTMSMMVRYPGAQSEELEAVVAKPYEASLASVKGVKKVQTISQEDVCFMLIDFVWGTDLDAAAADIRETVSWIEPYMPDDVEAPILIKMNLSSMPLAFYTVTGLEDVVLMKKMMEDVVQPRMERLDGVAQAAFMGGREREVKVLVDRAAMEGTGVNPDQVMMALAYQNLNMPAGRLITDRREELLRTTGMYHSLRDVENTAVGMSMATGAPVRLGAIADVEWGLRDVRNAVRSDGLDALMFMVSKESGANPLQVRRAYIEEMEAVGKLIPEEIEFGILFDMGQVIERMGTSVAQSGTIGALLAVIIMFLFLRNIRPTATIATVIPLSLLATFIPIYISGDTLNIMTMGGLVLGIGMLVDNAVVVIENIFRHLEGGKGRKEAAKIGAREVGTAIIASTLTTVVVFLPIVLGGGLASRLARGLALTVAAALFASLFVALTIVPMLASVFFTNGKDRKKKGGLRLFARFRARYTGFLTWCVNHRWVTVGGVVLLLALTLGTTPFIGAEFMPSSDAPIVLAKISFPVGTSMEETAAGAARIEGVLRQYPDVKTVGAMVGVDENDPTAGMSATNPAGVHEAVLFVRLQEKEDRVFATPDDFTDELREHLPEVEGMRIEFLGMDAQAGGSSTPVDIKVYGQDMAVIDEWSDRIVEVLSGIEGVEDVDKTLKVAKPERHIVIDRDKAAGYGLTIGQVAATVKTATLGTVASRYRESGEEYNVRVQYAERYRDTEAALEQIQIALPAGGSIPLGQIATLEPGLGPVKITREDQTRRFSVTANLAADANLGQVMKKVTAAVAPVQAQIPPGYTIEYGGQYEDMMEAFGQMALALALAILLVYMVMASQFESFAQPFTIMFTMPLGLIGVIWIFLLTGTTLSVTSFIGVILLAGIVVNNGIVMLDYIRQLRREGKDLKEAVIEGASVRLRPVMITSLTTIFAMVPMAVSRAEGSESMAPMALTVIGGLAAASVFTLVVVPVAYTLVDGLAVRGGNLWAWMFHRTEYRARKAAALAGPDRARWQEEDGE